MFHTHKWIILNEKFNPGMSQTGGNAKNLYGDEFGMMIVFGCTSISMKCSECGEPRIKMMVGEYVPNG